MGGVCDANNVVGTVAQNINLQNLNFGDGQVQSLISQAYNFIKANLPTDWGMSEEESQSQTSTFSQFSTYLAKPEPKPIYEEQLQLLDTMGAINLTRITRENWPSKETNYFALLSINTYEEENYSLGVQIVTDAINIAQVYKAYGYRIAYLFNSSAKDFYKWVDFFIEIVKKEVSVYFAGVATNIVVNSNITQILAFRNREKTVDGQGDGRTVIPAIPGVGENSVSEDYILDMVERAAKPQLRTVFYTNVLNQPNVFVPNPATPVLNSATAEGAKHRIPPYKSIYIQCNSSTVVNQHKFVEGFMMLMRSSGVSFAQLRQQFITQPIAVPPNYGITINAHDDALYDEAVICVIPIGDEELQVEAITPSILGTHPSQVTALPDTTVLSPAEIEGAEQRWALFVQEMKKSPNYDSKYKESLKALDSLGSINLERLNRTQIPNIKIDRVAALFFCPYEDLEHTLDLGPINDALTMAQLFLGQGYKIVYIMDATPKEFYSWMDWLLSNIKGEIMVYFSGHGTQIRDTSGKEADGLSELLVFYNDSLKTTKLPKIKAVPGITDMTVSDDCLHELIILKDYPDTRIVLISDCCHSGTMYNFDSAVNIPVSRPPLNVVCIGAAKDSQTAKQTVLGGKESGVFTYSLNTLIRKQATSTFIDLEAYTKKNIGKYQDINLTTTNKALLSQPIIGQPLYSADPTSRNYSPANATIGQLVNRIKTATTSIPPGGERVKKVLAATGSHISTATTRTFAFPVITPTTFVTGGLSWSMSTAKLKPMNFAPLEKSTTTQVTSSSSSSSSSSSGSTPKTITISAASSTTTSTTSTPKRKKKKPPVVVSPSFSLTMETSDTPSVTPKKKKKKKASASPKNTPSPTKSKKKKK